MREMPLSKRPGEEAEDGPGSARKKVAGSTRTGQACDRCKIRKIRCDARPGGCSPCLQNNTECKTTDRITGRATSRGHTETIENENASLKMYMVELQQQLREHGVEPKPLPSAPQGYGPAQPQYWEQNEQQSSWGDLDGGGAMVSAASQPERQGSQGALLPDFRRGCIGDNYVGVSSGNNWLSPIEGTSLALFGMKIDLAEFLPPDSDSVSSPMSYQTFLTHAFGGPSQQTRAPRLPPMDQCRVYSEWFFRSVQTFVPILHKPDFLKLLTRIHHAHYVPNTSETVMVHMVLAIINNQYAMRNQNEESRTNAMNHYHYALTFVPQLIAGHKLQDIQALALICVQLRSQPRSGAAWMFTNMTLSLAIELGLHRSAVNWQGSGAEHDPHVIEMRKRVFWSLLELQVSMSGKLGRPMPLRLSDFDIEIPEPVFDNLPGEQNASNWRKCSFRAALFGMGLVKVFIKVYATVYSIRSTNEPYDTNVQQIEKELQAWKSTMPPELSGGPQTQEEDRVSALYLQLSEHEVRLLLHHPSLCRSGSPQVAANNLDVCLDVSNKILIIASQLKQLKSLDSTWYYTTVYLASIFTTLFAFTQRQEQVTSADLQKLRQDMDLWLDVMGDLGDLLGSGPRLQEAIGGIVDYSLSNISRHIAARTASASLASAGSPTNGAEQAVPQQQMQQEAANGYFNAYANGNANGAMPAAPQQFNQYYPEQPGQNMPPYTSAPMAPFDASTTYPTEDMKPNLDAQLNAPHMPQQVPHQQPQMTPHQQPPATFLAAFQSPTQAQNGFQPQQPQQPTYTGGPVAWRNFTDTVMTNFGGQEYMTSANALMALGGGGKPDGSGGMEMGATPQSMAAMAGLQMGVPEVQQQQPWPLIHYSGPTAEGQ